MKSKMTLYIVQTKKSRFFELFPNQWYSTGVRNPNFDRDYRDCKQPCEYSKQFWNSVFTRDKQVTVGLQAKSQLQTTGCL